MKKYSQSEIILKVLESDKSRWYFSYELIKMNTPWGFLGIQSPRRSREMAEVGSIDVKHEGKYVQYRYKILEDVPKIKSFFLQAKISQVSLPLSVFKE